MTTAPIQPVPALSSRLAGHRPGDHDVIPLLGHLDQVGPGINQLLDRVSQLSHMASRLPTVFRQRNDQTS